MTWLVRRCLPLELTFDGELLGRVSGGVALDKVLVRVDAVRGVSVGANVGAIVGCADPLGWSTTVSLASGSYWPSSEPNWTDKVSSFSRS